MKKNVQQLMVLVLAFLMVVNPIFAGTIVWAADSFSVNLTVEGINDITLPLTTVQFDGPAGETTALDALKQALDAEDIDYEIEEYDWGVMITGIGGESSGAFGHWDGWMYSINGESPWVGAADYILEPDDEVVFYYNRWPNISTESVINSGDEEPFLEVAIIGDEFTVSATNTANWDISIEDTGLEIDSIRKDGSQNVTIFFSGTAETGVISLTAKAGALGGETDSNELEVDILKIGDLNSNGEIDIGDAILVLRYVAMIQVFDDNQLIKADVNKDGKINVTDAILILRYIVQLIEEFPDETPLSDAEKIEAAIEKTVEWYNLNHPAPQSWDGMPALIAAGADLNTAPWETTREWRNEDPGFEADDGNTNHPQYIFRLLSVDINPADVWGGRNLYAELSLQQEDNGSIGMLGKHIWSMVAFDIGAEIGLDLGAWDNEKKVKAVEYLLSEQNIDGSFGAFSELDFTGWALVALSKHRDIPKVSKAIDDAVAYFKSKQQDTAGFAMEGEWGAENSNSNSSAITGLIAAGEDLLDVEGDWIKNDNSVLDAILKYQQEDGSFWYMEDTEGAKKMSTVQCLMALASLKKGEPGWQKLSAAFILPE